MIQYMIVLIFLNNEKSIHVIITKISKFHIVFRSALLLFTKSLAHTFFSHFRVRCVDVYHRCSSYKRYCQSSAWQEFLRQYCNVTCGCCGMFLHAFSMIFYLETKLKSCSLSRNFSFSNKLCGPLSL